MLTPEQESEIQAICTELEMSLDEAKARLAEIAEYDYLAAFAPEQRALHAVKIFKAQTMAQLASNASDFTFTVLATSHHDRGKGKDGKPFYIPGRTLAIGGPKDGPVGLVNIAFFEDHEAKRDTLVPGSTYQARLTLSNDVNKAKPIYQCSVDASFRAKEHPTPVQPPQPFEDWLKQLLHHVPVSEFEDPKHHSKEYELRLVIGSVAYGNIRNTKIGPMANLHVYDDSVPHTKEAKRLSVRVHPADFRFGAGSDIVAIGPLKKRTGKNRDGDVQDYLTLNSNFAFVPPNGLLVPREAPRGESTGAATDDSDDEAVDVSDFQ